MIRVIKIIFGILILLLLLSCKKEYKDVVINGEIEVHRHYHKSEIIREEYFKHGKLFLINFYSENKIKKVHLINKDGITVQLRQGNTIDYLTYFINNQKDTISYGKSILNKNKFLPYGWYIYKNNSENEYFIINDSSFVNQIIIYKDFKNNIIDSNNSLFYKDNILDTVETNKKYTFNISLVYKKKGLDKLYSSTLILSDKFNDDLSNYNDSYDLKPYKATLINKNSWKFEKTFTKKGENFIKGFIYLNDVILKDSDVDSAEYEIINKNIFIKKPVYVK